MENTYRIRIRLADGTEKTKIMFTPLSKAGALDQFQQQQRLPVYSLNGGDKVHKGYAQPQGEANIEEIEEGGPILKGPPIEASSFVQ